MTKSGQYFTRRPVTTLKLVDGKLGVVCNSGRQEIYYRMIGSLYHLIQTLSHFGLVNERIYLCLWRKQSYFVMMIAVQTYMCTLYNAMYVNVHCTLVYNEPMVREIKAGLLPVITALYGSGKRLRQFNELCFVSCHTNGSSPGSGSSIDTLTYL